MRLLTSGYIDITGCLKMDAIPWMCHMFEYTPSLADSLQSS